MIRSSGLSSLAFSSESFFAIHALLHSDLVHLVVIYAFLMFGIYLVYLEKRSNWHFENATKYQVKLHEYECIDYWSF